MFCAHFFRLHSVLWPAFQSFAWHSVLQYQTSLHKEHCFTLLRMVSVLPARCVEAPQNGGGGALREYLRKYVRPTQRQTTVRCEMSTGWLAGGENTDDGRFRATTGCTEAAEA